MVLSKYVQVTEFLLNSTDKLQEHFNFSLKLSQIFVKQLISVEGGYRIDNIH